MSDDPMRLMRFVLEMRQAGVTDARALSAMERTPRTHYAPAHMEQLALDDVALPLAGGQIMTKPSLIGRMLMALNAQPTDVVLEIGAGSGFQAACLAQMAHKVISLERQRDLCAAARGAIGRARLMRVFVHLGDGALGFADEAPFDRIILNAAVTEVPAALLGQLKPGGVLVAPVNDGEAQRLIRVSGETREDLGAILGQTKFASLQPGVPDETA